MGREVPFIGEEGQILLFDTGDDALCEFLLSCLEESGIVVEISLDGLLGANFIAIG